MSAKTGEKSRLSGVSQVKTRFGTQTKSDTDNRQIILGSGPGPNKSTTHETLCWTNYQVFCFSFPGACYLKEKTEWMKKWDTRQTKKNRIDIKVMMKNCNQPNCLVIRKSAWIFFFLFGVKVFYLQDTICQRSMNAFEIEMLCTVGRYLMRLQTQLTLEQR